MIIKGLWNWGFCSLTEFTVIFRTKSGQKVKLKKTVWGKGLAAETINDEVVRIGQRMAYTLVVRKDPKKDYVRIKALPASRVDLTSCYNILKKKDPQATWFLHASKKMLLNGSIKNPESKPTRLTMREIVDVLKNSKK